jgi:hypothetical protein
MKTSTFKKMIKDAVKEAIQEELKDILLEAVKSPKQNITESHNPVNLSSKPPTVDLRNGYMDILNETALGFTSKDVAQPFNPKVGGDSINGTLPEGELSMDQITNLMMGK